jgi:general secretion pathway protein G
MRACKAFTLVEILIVVVILGILAAIVLPRFSNASSLARASMLADDLRVLRTQLAVYKAQHQDTPAGYPDGDRTQAPTEAALLAQMTMASRGRGETAPIGTLGFDYGPYLREMTPNPLNGKSSVQIIGDAVAFPAAGDDSHGWVYQPSTLVLRGDNVGADDKGRLYFEY